MPIVSNVSNKQMNVGKIQIKGGGGVRYPPFICPGTVPGHSPTGHLPGTCHTDSQWRIKNTKELTLNLNKGVSKNEEASGRGRTKGKKLQGNSKQATRAKLRGNGLNAHSKCDHLLTKGNLPVKYDY